MITWTASSDKSMFNGSVQTSWEYRIRNYGSSKYDVTIWDNKKQCWAFIQRFGTSEEAIQWCEMYEATGARE